MLLKKIYICIEALNSSKFETYSNRSYYKRAKLFRETEDLLFPLPAAPVRNKLS